MTGIKVFIKLEGESNMTRKLTSKEKKELKTMKTQYKAIKKASKQLDILVKTTVNPKVKRKLLAESRETNRKLTHIEKELGYFKSIS